MISMTPALGALLLVCMVPPTLEALPPENCRTLGVTRQAMLGHDDSVNCLDIMPQRPLLISGSDDGIIIFRESERESIIHMLC